MRKRSIPNSYYYEVMEKISWNEVLAKLGIKFKKTQRGIGIYMAKCVFHKENTPSLIFTVRGTFYCFGCGKRGDIFQFISLVLTNKLYNVRACRWLKKCFDIPLPWDR